MPIALPRDRSDESEAFCDEDLVILSRSNSWALETLVRRHLPRIQAKARSYFLMGGEHDDLVQEGLIGLFEAVRDFREGKSSFRGFADLCIGRQIITAIRSASRHKHGPLNHYVSLGSSMRNHSQEEADSLPAPPPADPLYAVVTGEELEDLIASLEEGLSSLESDVLLLYLEGKNYQEIAERLGCRMKSIDNALQRIKRKVLAVIQTRSSDEKLAALAC